MLSSILKPFFLIRFVLVSAVLAVLGLIVVFIVLQVGFISFAAEKPVPRWFYSVVHGAFKNSVAFQSRNIVPPDTLEDPGLIALGARHYAQTCARCHGGPGLGQNPQVLAMEPTPQHLPAVVDQFDAEGLYWIVQNGVMMSAMPAWPTADRPDEPWALVAFLNQLPEMSPEEYLALSTTNAVPDNAIPFGDSVESVEMNRGGRVPYPAEEHALIAPSTNFADYAMAGIPVAQCAACHGADGTGAPTGGHAPNLAIQNADYLASALRAYRSGDRKSGFMQVVATQLSDRQIDDLAAYFADLPDLPGPSQQVSQDVLDRGEQIATAGLVEAGAPACASCHGSDAYGPMIPVLAGQSAPFIEQQLNIFRTGGRGGGADVAWNPMHFVAHDLGDEDVTAVAAYFASLEPGAPAELQSVDVATAEDLITQVCSKCHTADMVGVSSGEYPNLTLQNAAYITTQLHAFRTNTRDVERMRLAAVALEPAELSALAGYIENLPPAAQDGEPIDGDTSVGQQIATEGLPDRGVQACMTCHAPEQMEKMPIVPNLHGQYARYLERRLEGYQGMERGEGIPGSPMPEIASELTDSEIAGLAAWFSEQAPQPKVAAAN